jgi:hypothetical protein
MCVHRHSGAQRAVKVLRKKEMDEEEKKMLFNEINILRELVSIFFADILNLFIINFISLINMNSILKIGPPQHCQNVRIL